MLRTKLKNMENMEPNIRKYKILHKKYGTKCENILGQNVKKYGTKCENILGQNVCDQVKYTIGQNVMSCKRFFGTKFLEINNNNMGQNN